MIETASSAADDLLSDDFVERFVSHAQPAIVARDGHVLLVDKRSGLGKVSSMQAG